MPRGFVPVPNWRSPTAVRSHEVYRAAAAVIALMRHRTTAYESMKIPRIKGKRRDVRLILAQRSHELLDNYRKGESIGEECPLKKALADGK